MTDVVPPTLGGEQLLLAAGRRRLRVAVTVDPVAGALIYDVDTVGVYTVVPDVRDYPISAGRLEVRYGLATGAHQSGSGRTPQAPSFYGVEIHGACMFDPADHLDNPADTWWRWLACHRRTGTLTSVSAPAGVRARNGEVVWAITGHYLTRPYRLPLLAARARFMAPGRLAQHNHLIGGLRDRETAARAAVHARLAEAATQQALAAGDPVPAPETAAVDIAAADLQAAAARLAAALLDRIARAVRDTHPTAAVLQVEQPDDLDGAHMHLTAVLDHVGATLASSCTGGAGATRRFEDLADQVDPDLDAIADLGRVTATGDRLDLPTPPRS